MMLYRPAKVDIWIRLMYHNTIIIMNYKIIG